MARPGYRDRRAYAREYYRRHRDAILAAQRAAYAANPGPHRERQRHYETTHRAAINARRRDRRACARPLADPGPRYGARRREGEALLRAGHLSQSEIARRLGVSRQLVSQWRRAMTISDLHTLTDAQLVRTLTHVYEMRRAELARRTGVSERTVSRWIAGTHAPSEAERAVLEQMLDEATQG